MIDNSPAPSRLVNADALGEELKFYPRRPRPKSVRPGQARHFATHTQGLFRVNRYRFGRDHLSTNVRFPSNTDRKFSALGFVAMGPYRRHSAIQSITSSARARLDATAIRSRNGAL